MGHAAQKNTVIGKIYRSQLLVGLQQPSIRIHGHLEELGKSTILVGHNSSCQAKDICLNR